MKEPKVCTPLVLRLWHFRHYTTRSCLVISVKTIVNFVPLKKSYLGKLNQHPNKILNGHCTQFLKLSVHSIEENISSWDAMFRLQRDESSAVTSLFVGWFWHKNLPSLLPPSPRVTAITTLKQRKTWWNRKPLGCLFTKLTWACFEVPSSSLRPSLSSAALIFDHRE